MEDISQNNQCTLSTEIFDRFHQVLCFVLVINPVFTFRENIFSQVILTDDNQENNIRGQEGE